jgi:UrcA family protein
MASICTIANAGSPEQSTQRTVRFADLDLSRPAGVAVLYQRIRVAAWEVCQPLNERDLMLLAASRSCVRDAIDHAVDDVHSLTLSRYHQTKTEAIIIAASR